MEIVWHITDSYDTWDQHDQVTVIPDKLLDKCKTEEDRQRLIDRYVERDFRARISWVIPAENQIR